MKFLVPQELSTSSVKCTFSVKNVIKLYIIVSFTQMNQQNKINLQYNEFCDVVEYIINNSHNKILYNFIKDTCPWYDKLKQMYRWNNDFIINNPMILKQFRKYSNEIKYFIINLQIFQTKEIIINKWNKVLNYNGPYQINHSYKISTKIHKNYNKKINQTIKNFWCNHQSIQPDLNNIIKLLLNGDPQHNILILLNKLHKNNLWINKLQMYCNQIQKITKYNQYITYSTYINNKSMSSKYYSNLSSLIKFRNKFCEINNEWEYLAFIYNNFFYTIQWINYIPNLKRKQPPQILTRPIKQRKITLTTKIYPNNDINTIYNPKPPPLEIDEDEPNIS